jgi:ribose transport system permease protein
MSAAATTASPRRVTARAIEGQELALLGVLAVLWLVLSFAVDTFFTASTLQDLMAAVAPVAIVGVGMTAIIVTGGIDVSVAAPWPWPWSGSASWSATAASGSSPPSPSPSAPSWA